MWSKPAFKKNFGPELKRNLEMRYEHTFSVQDVIDEGIYYALDMCLEFKRQSDGLLTEEWIHHIGSEVFYALNEYVCDISAYKSDFISRILLNMRDPIQAKKSVDIYYNRI